MKKLAIAFAAFLMLGSMYLVQVKSAINAMPAMQTVLACKSSSTNDTIVVDAQATGVVTYNVIDEVTGEIIGSFTTIQGKPVIKKYTVTANSSHRYGVQIVSASGTIITDFMANYSCALFPAYFPAPAKQ